MGRWKEFAIGLAAGGLVSLAVVAVMILPSGSSDTSSAIDANDDGTRARRSRRAAHVDPDADADKYAGATDSHGNT